MQPSTQHLLRVQLFLLFTFVVSAQILEPFSAIPNEQRDVLSKRLSGYVAAYQHRRVSTTLRQVLTKFSEVFVCWIRVPSFPQEISRQDRLATTIGNSVDPQHPRFCRFSGAFRFFKSRSLRFICILPQAVFPEWTPAC